MKVFKKEISKNKLFTEYIEILNGLLQLSGREKDIFILLLKINDQKPKLDNILHKDIRQFIMKEMKLKKSNLSNYISTLKKRGMILENEKGYYINPMFIPEVEEDLSKVTFILDIKE